MIIWQNSCLFQIIVQRKESSVKYVDQTEMIGCNIKFNITQFVIPLSFSSFIALLSNVKFKDLLIVFLIVYCCLLASQYGGSISVVLALKSIRFVCQ